MTRHCHQCGTEYTLHGQPGRLETCPTCGVDLKVCLNCIHYDTTVACQCRERRAEPVDEKHMANYCEHFEMVRREWKGRAADPRADAARDKLRRLFGD